MLLIRPLLETNKERRFVAHTLVVFIFIVCNCGGCLLPIGDPPLFMFYLRGVPFGWTLTLWKEWLLVNGLLLAAYAAIAPHVARQELIVEAALTGYRGPALAARAATEAALDVL